MGSVVGPDPVLPARPERGVGAPDARRGPTLRAPTDGGRPRLGRGGQPALEVRPRVRAGQGDGAPGCGALPRGGSPRLHLGGARCTRGAAHRPRCALPGRRAAGRAPGGGADPAHGLPVLQRHARGLPVPSAARPAGPGAAWPPRDGQLGRPRLFRRLRRRQPDGSRRSLRPGPRGDRRVGPQFLPRRLPPELGQGGLYRRGRPRRHDGAMTPPGIAGLVLTPGASAGREQSGLIAIDAAVSAVGVVVERVEFPGQAAGKRRTDPPAVCVQTVRDATAALAERLGVSTARIAIGGRSFGGRMCSMAVAERLEVAALVLVSYPLHPPGRPERLRTEHFPALRLPCLFVSGRRDAFATPEELERETAAIPGPVTRMLVDGDHSLRKSEAEVAEIVASWVSAIALRT